MERRMRHTCAVASFAALTLAACGGDDDSTADRAPDTTAPASTVAQASTTLSPTTTASTTTTEARTTEAPTTVVTTTEPELEQSLTDEVLTQMGDDQIAAMGGVECATEVALIFAAAQRYSDELGSAPESLDDLYDSGMLETELVLWVGDDLFIHPVEGSGCIDVFTPDICSSEAQGVEAARLDYLEANPGAAEPTQDDLVAAELLDAASTLVELVDGSAVAVAGGRCDGVDFTVDWTSECQAEAKTLEVAQEAFQAMNGEDTNPTEAELSPDFMRHTSAFVDLVDGAVVAAPAGPCAGLISL
jgi:hypothetical protein